MQISSGLQVARKTVGEQAFQIEIKKFFSAFEIYGQLISTASRQP